MNVGDKEDAKEEDVAMTDDGTKDSSLTKEELDKDGKTTDTTASTSSSSTDHPIDVESSDGEEERGQWGSPAEFLLSCLGFAVGLGNIWRFPYLCYVNGGGAFLIPYVIMLVFVGLPGFLVELAIGQYCGGGPMDVWSVSPIFQGIGAGMVMVTFISNINYNMLLGWSLWYMALSWQAVLPWSVCTHDYNTPYCYTKPEADPCEKSEPGSIWFNQTCYNATYIRQFDVPMVNCTNITMSSTVSWLDPNCSSVTNSSVENYQALCPLFGIFDLFVP